MKKFLTFLLVLFLGLGLFACKEKNPDPKPDPDPEDEFMSYEEYAKAKVGAEVTVQCYVQATQGWWSDNGVGKLTVYAADDNGGYFIYNMNVEESDAAKFVKGAKIEVKGTKAEWAGEVEITDATYKFLEGTKVYDAKDATASFADLSAYANQLVTLKGLTVLAMDNAKSGFFYKYNNSGEAGQNCDLYYKVGNGKATYTFVVESYLCGENTDVYRAVTGLHVGDVIDVTGFAYWYNAAQLHTTNVAVKGNVNTKATGVMTYAEYATAELGAEVTVECYVQDHQSWWEKDGQGKLTIYAADVDGGYFIYELPIDKANADKLVPGTKIKVTGTKSEWAGEVEIADATYEILDGYYLAAPVDATESFADLSAYANQLVLLKGLTVVAMDEAGEKAFFYKYNNSGEAGQNCDLYYKVTDGTTTYTFVVESYLYGEETDVYKAVTELNVGDTVTITGFAYWYNAAQLHTTAIEVATEK